MKLFSKERKKKVKSKQTLTVKTHADSDLSELEQWFRGHLHVILVVFSSWTRLHQKPCKAPEYEQGRVLIGPLLVDYQHLLNWTSSELMSIARFFRRERKDVTFFGLNYFNLITVYKIEKVNHLSFIGN